jgi:hypothetical protein
VHLDWINVSQHNYYIANTTTILSTQLLYCQHYYYTVNTTTILPTQLLYCQHNYYFITKCEGVEHSTCIIISLHTSCIVVMHLVVHVNGVRLCLWTVTSNWPIVYLPDNI